MLKVEKTEVLGWEHVIRGMRNPKNSWDRTDSCRECSAESLACPYGEGATLQIIGIQTNNRVILGPNDYNLMKTLRNAGTDHRKFMRMIVVYADITAPLYWWKEYDTYKVGTVANSCSTMHKIHAKEFTLDDFSHEHLLSHNERDLEYMVLEGPNGNTGLSIGGIDLLSLTINLLNYYRKKFIETNEKRYWWQLIQLLPSSYNQKRTVMLNYEVLANIYKSRKNHKLDEWHTFCDWIKSLPYSELITGEFEEEKENG